MRRCCLTSGSHDGEERPEAYASRQLTMQRGNVGDRTFPPLLVWQEIYSHHGSCSVEMDVESEGSSLKIDRVGIEIVII